MTLDKENMPPVEDRMDLDQPYLPPTQDATQHEDDSTNLADIRRQGLNPPPFRDLPLPPETLSGHSAALVSQEPMTTPRTRIDSPPLMEDVPCQVCTGRDDEETMLLCDHGYHIDCLEPALARVPRGPWLCPLCDQIADAVPSRDIVDDEEVLDYLAADKRHRPGTSRKDAKRIARRAQNYYFAAEEFPFELNGGPATGHLYERPPEGFGSRTVPWYEDRLDIVKEYARRIPDINGPMLHRSKEDQPIPSTSQRPR
eukprot:jgi/Botrbrau1/16173/Bobra.0377s0001.1